jgi:hypothetical protein
MKKTIITKRSIEMKKTVAVAVFLFVVAVSGAFGQTTADEWFKKAEGYFNEGDYANAITAYSEAIKKDNTNLDAYWGRGFAYHQIKNYNSAIADYNAALKINPNDVYILICRGDVYFDRKDYNAAIADYNTILKITPNDWTAYWYRGVAYFQIKNYDATITDLTTYINKNGTNTNANAYIVRGDAYGAKGIYHKAVADYKTAIEKGYDPDKFEVGKPKNTVMSFCMPLYMEILVNRFLGKSDVVAKYENWLKTVSDKNKVTRQEIEAFYRDNVRALIAGVVDEEFNKISFNLRNSDTFSIARGHNAVLTRNPQNGQYKLSYGGAYTNEEIREITKPTLNALLDEMGRRDKDFDKTGIEVVKAQAALIPAAALSDAALTEITNILTRFYTEPNQSTYTAVVETYSVMRQALLNTQNNKYTHVANGYANMLSVLNEGFAQKVFTDVRSVRSITTLTREQQQRLTGLR